MMRWSMTTDPGTDEPPSCLPGDPAGNGRPVVSLEHLLRQGGPVRGAVVPQRARTRGGDTPIFGEGAVARWVALHDRARELRSALRPRDSVGERQARRAIRSLFLYEHALTPKTRRQARTRLWERDRSERLPPFVERVRWAQCRCPRCQASDPSQGPTGYAQWFMRRSA